LKAPLQQGHKSWLDCIWSCDWQPALWPCQRSPSWYAGHARLYVLPRIFTPEHHQ